MSFHDFQFRHQRRVIQCCCNLTNTASHALFHLTVIINTGHFVAACSSLAAQFDICREHFTGRKDRTIDIVTAHCQVCISVSVAVVKCCIVCTDQVCYMFIIFCSYFRLCHFRCDQRFTAHACIHNRCNRFNGFFLIHFQTVFFFCNDKFTIFSCNSTVFCFTVKFFCDLSQFCIHQCVIICIGHFDIDRTFQQFLAHFEVFFFCAGTACFIGSLYCAFHIIASADFRKRNFPFHFFHRLFFRNFLRIFFRFIVQCQHLTIDFCFVLILQHLQSFRFAKACHICTINGHPLIDTFCRQQLLNFSFLNMMIAKENRHCRCNDHHCDNRFAAAGSLRHSWSFTQAFRPLIFSFCPLLSQRGSCQILLFFRKIRIIFIIAKST